MVDSSVKKIRPKDLELSMVQENLSQAIQQIQDHVNGSQTPQQATYAPLLQQVRGPGTASSIQQPGLAVQGDTTNSGGNSVVFGTAATQTNPQYNANTQLYGDLTQSGNYSTSGTITTTQDVTCLDLVATKSVVSPTGFKMYVPMGHVNFQTTMNGIYRTVDVTVNTVNNSYQYQYVNKYMPFSGSVVGIACMINAQLNQNVTFQVFRNNYSGNTGQMIDTGSGSGGIPSGRMTPTTPGTYAKGQYTFYAGDQLGMGVYCGSGATFIAQCGLIVEMGA